MKNSNFKSLLLVVVVLASLVSFIHVNSSSINIDSAGVVQSSVEVNEATTKDSKLPDLKIMKFVLTIVGKFTTSK